MEDAGAALAGAGVGAFAEHEWEVRFLLGQYESRILTPHPHLQKHKQEAAYEEGRRKGQEEQRRRGTVL